VSLLLVLLLSCPADSPAAAARAPAPVQAPAAPAATDGVRVRRFAAELFAQGEYFRAMTEYLRAASWEPAAPDADELRFMAARCAFRAGRFDEAATRFAGLAAGSSSTAYRDECLLFASASRYRAKAWRDARAVLSTARQELPDSPLADRRAYIEGLSLVHEGAWNAAGTAFDTIPVASPLHASAGELSALADRASRTRWKSPPVTAAMSAVMPGLGQMVCGYPWDGLSALLLTGAGIAIGVAGIQSDNDAVAVAGFSFGGLFHVANIAGGANAARRRNARVRDEYLREADLLNRLELE